MPPKLLILELWGIGDLVIASAFIRAAAEKFAVTLLAKPFAVEMQPRLWPTVEVVPFVAPWTAFRAKYQLWSWPWPEMVRMRRELRSRKFDCAVSARWDPRDHFLLKSFGARERLGFPRLKSQRYLTRRLDRPDPLAHRYEHWRVAGAALGLTLPPQSEIAAAARTPSSQVFIHTGARFPLRVWPLANFLELARRLREKNYAVQIACDQNQLAWWRSQGENAVSPRTVNELMGCLDQAGVFIGNDSGPGHLAAALGLPTFTLFGPQLHEWFAPLHPAAEVMEGRACPYKPCADYCRYREPFCLWKVPVDEVWPRVEKFAAKHLRPAAAAGDGQSGLTRGT